MRLAVLLSGSGRTFFNLLAYQTANKLKGNIVCVISSKKEVDSNTAIFQHCRSSQIPIQVFNPLKFNSLEEFSHAQTTYLDQFQLDLICLAGYLKFWQIPPHFHGKVINIHPSLLPKFGGKGFYGLKVHEAVLKAGEQESGCTVHFATNEYDVGPIILQRKVPVSLTDTPESLAARVFIEEQQAYPAAINLLADKETRIKKVVGLLVSDASFRADFYFNPQIALQARKLILTPFEIQQLVNEKSNLSVEILDDRIKRRSDDLI